MSNFISAGFIIASIGLFFGYINPTYGGLTGESELKKQSIRELTEARDRYAEALNKTREIEDARKGLLAKYNGIPAEDKERLLKLLPDHIDSVRLIIDVNNVASQYGMTLKNISLIDTPKQGETALGPQQELVQAVGLRFTVSGSYDKFRSFLRDLEQSLRLVDVRAITFNTEEDTYTYSVMLSTYKLNYSGRPQ